MHLHVCVRTRGFVFIKSELLFMSCMMFFTGVEADEGLSTAGFWIEK